MNTMWVNAEVDAMVQYRTGLAYPVLRAIRWLGRRVDFAPLGRIEPTTRALHYSFHEGTTRDALRFEPGGQRWILEQIDDNGLAESDASERKTPAT